MKISSNMPTNTTNTTKLNELKLNDLFIYHYNRNNRYAKVVSEIVEYNHGGPSKQKVIYKLIEDDVFTAGASYGLPGIENQGVYFEIEKLPYKSLKEFEKFRPEYFL